MAKGDARIILGSGKLYVTEFASTIPDDATLEVEANLLGSIQGGASLSYKPSFYECSDDLGTVKKKMLTEEEVVLKSGIMTWNSATLKKLCGTATVDSTVSGKRSVKIGGVGNYDGKQYVIRFVHEDAIGGDLRVTIVGSNEAGFEMAFAKDKETVINAEFKAAPMDINGTLIQIDEEVVAG